MECIGTAATRPADKRVSIPSSDVTISSHGATPHTCSKPVSTAGGRTSTSRYFHHNRSWTDADP